jgi:hypothetical protein
LVQQTETSTGKPVSWRSVPVAHLRSLCALIQSNKGAAHHVDFAARVDARERLRFLIQFPRQFLSRKSFQKLKALSSAELRDGSLMKSNA